MLYLFVPSLRLFVPHLWDRNLFPDGKWLNRHSTNIVVWFFPEIFAVLMKLKLAIISRGSIGQLMIFSTDLVFHCNALLSTAEPAANQTITHYVSTDGLKGPLQYLLWVVLSHNSKRWSLRGPFWPALMCWFSSWEPKKCVTLGTWRKPHSFYSPYW